MAGDNSKKTTTERLEELEQKLQDQSSELEELRKEKAELAENFATAKAKLDTVEEDLKAAEELIEKDAAVPTPKKEEEPPAKVEEPNAKDQKDEHGLTPADLAAAVADATKGLNEKEKTLDEKIAACDARLKKMEDAEAAAAIKQPGGDDTAVDPEGTADPDNAAPAKIEDPVEAYWETFEGDKTLNPEGHSRDWLEHHAPELAVKAVASMQQKYGLPDSFDGSTCAEREAKRKEAEAK